MPLTSKTLVELELIARLSDPVWYRGGTVAGGGLPLVFTVPGAGPTFFGLNFDEFFDPATAKIRASALPSSHDAVTLGGGSDAALSLSGQELTLANVLTPTEHTAIGASAPHHASFLQADADLLYEALGDIAIHAAIAGAHHVAFVQADADLLYEALGDIAIHAAIAGAHHTAFVQADADLLYEALGDIAIHAAIAGAHHNAITIGADAAHSLAVQVLSAVLAATGQTGHMSGAMFDKLDGIEALANVTDAANVDAAGAVMEADFNADTFLYATLDNTPVATSPADVLAALSGHAGADFAMNTNKFTGVKDPTAAQDAATKNYVDGRKQLKTVPFAATQEDAQVETMFRLPGICIGESGEMGTVTGVRFKVSCGTAGVTGTMTVKLYADSAPNFPSETEIASVNLTTGIEGNDTSISGWSPGTDNWLRAKITAIHSGTPAKDVVADFYFEVTEHA